MYINTNLPLGERTITIECEGKTYSGMVETKETSEIVTYSSLYLIVMLFNSLTSSSFSSHLALEELVPLVTNNRL